MCQGLKLISLSINHKNKDILDIDFIDINKDYEEDILTSVLIGVNGVGKSFILSTIVDVFRFVTNKNYILKYENYLLKYLINNTLYTIKINNRKLYLYKDNKRIDSPELFTLPDNVLALAFLINDKFPFKQWNGLSENDDEMYVNDIYEYMGIRQVSNASWISTISKRIADCIIENSNSLQFVEILKETLKFLGFDTKIKLNIYSEQKTFFKRKLSLEKLNKKINGIKKSNSIKSYMAREFKDEDKKQIVNFVNNISFNKYYEVDNEECFLEYDIDMEKKNINELIKYNNIIRKLSDIKFIKPPKVYLSKKNEFFSFDDCSSGEKQLIFTIINMASKIKRYSLVLIDEPEISLHPNWQMGYINFIKRVFREYYGCHIILATHSHYLISDLEGKSSSIVVLERKEDGYIKSKLIQSDTYAWSAENILYNIFEVRTTRNYYFEADLRRIVSIVKNNEVDNVSKLKALIIKLNKYIFDDKDPLKLILEDAERFIKNVSENK
ncbi:AAA family ATPase [Clostridium butyricum]|uniref:AAA family ATPase n=1 Tax=Clostridium butyricum TaxID=1492 RepID=UPI00136F856F|nr:AAA family ATPase [Clostridium butyricum]MZI82928.1 AAA family ATPase [Clostridium butyricum]